MVVSIEPIKFLTASNSSARVLIFMSFSARCWLTGRVRPERPAQRAARAHVDDALLHAHALAYPMVLFFVQGEARRTFA